ncbi:sulfur carrier protein ThiS [Fusobacterium sp. PH5-44]|uniref:sulfur carrier protein ThiS n=1 Tax=unclassified Fusobacterium TaxID=2648384 RepID=UPI003D22E85B
MIKLNGEEFPIDGEKVLFDIIKTLELDWKINLESTVVVVNEQLVKKENWKDTIIKSGNIVEVLSFVSGG